MATIPHTILRNETYHFNFRIVDKIYRKSLKTDSPSICRSYVSDILIFIREAKYLGKNVSKSDIDQFIEMLISNKVNEVSRIGKALTEPLSVTSNSYFESWYKLTKTQRVNLHFYNTDRIGEKPEYPSFTSWLSKRLTQIANYSDIKNQFTKFDPESEEYEVDIDHPLFDYFQYPSIQSEKYDYLNSLVIAHATNIAKASEQNSSIKAKMELEELHNKFSTMLPKQKAPEVIYETDNTTPPARHKTSILFEKIEDEFFSHLRAKGSSKKTIGDKKSEFKDLVSAFKGLFLDDITSDDIEERWFYICRLPKLDKVIAEKYEFSVDDKGLSANDRKEKQREKRWSIIYDTDEELLPTLIEGDVFTEGYLKKIKLLLREIFKFAKRKQYIEFDPFREDELMLSIPKNRSRERTALPIKHAISIVEYCFNNLSDPYSWAVLLMAYLGMRNEEVTSLLKEQIKTDEETSIVYIQVLKGKTRNARRKIPIHHRLLSMGFRDFVDNQTNSNLFNFDSKALTRKFTFFRTEFSIPKVDQEGKQLVLYSFRHNVVSFLGDVSEEHKYRLIGHGHKTVTTGYTKLDLEEGQRLINKVTYT